MIAKIAAGIVVKFLVNGLSVVRLAIGMKQAGSGKIAGSTFAAKGPTKKAAGKIVELILVVKERE